MESSKRIIFYRKKKNMTQDQLAEAANLSTSYISQVETGKKYRERRSGENSRSIGGGPGNDDSV